MRASFIGELDRIYSKWFPTHACLKTVFFGSVQINFLTLCPRRDLTYFDRCYSLYVWLLNAKMSYLCVAAKSQSLPPVSWVGLEVIIWEGFFYHTECKIVYLSALEFFEMERMARVSDRL